MILQLPFNLPDSVPGEVHEAFRQHANSIQDLQQSIVGPGGILAQIKGLKGGTSSSSASTTQIINSETVTPAASGTVAESGIVNDQTGATAYTTQQSDNGSLIVLDDASPVAVTLSNDLTIPWWCFLVNQGAGLVTLTPSAGTINGNPSVTLLGGYFALVFYDGVDFWMASLPIVPVNTPAVVHQWLNSYNATTGAFTQTQPAFTDISGVATVAQGGTGAATLSGVLFGNGTSAFTAATSAQIQTAIGAGVYDASGAAATAQNNAETFATGAVATETTRAEAAEATKQPLITGATGSITLAHLTLTGAQGSITIVNGIITAFVNPT